MRTPIRFFKFTQFYSTYGKHIPIMLQLKFFFKLTLIKETRSFSKQ